MTPISCAHPAWHLARDLRLAVPRTTSSVLVPDWLALAYDALLCASRLEYLTPLARLLAVDPERAGAVEAAHALAGLGTVWELLRAWGFCPSAAAAPKA